MEQIEQQEKKEDNTVLIGKKPTMNYVIAVATMAGSDKNPIFIKARGKLISKAVDVAQISIRKFVKTYKIANMSCATEEMKGIDRKTGREGPINVSVIAIELRK